MEQVTLTINGRLLTVLAGSTILEAARRGGIEIPTLCFDEAVAVYGACGLCVVEAEGSPKLLRACATTVREGMAVNTESERVVRARRIALELLMSAHDGDCVAPCQLACPAGTDCQGYVGLIANGEYEAALKLIKSKIPLPASIGRVCPHPCEKNCRRGKLDEPINIAQLKAFAADLDLNGAQYIPACAESTGKRVAVVGGGPGGLTAAQFLRRLGHAVTVYDMMPQMGGMLRYGIPEYRLPKRVLDAEIAVIEKTGVKLVNNCKLGRDVSLDTLRSENDAVILAPGAWKSSPMRVPGEELPGVYGGIDFLRSVILGRPVGLGARVAICGGGNTAMDACRTAVRLGAKEVTVVYRRTRDEMPAEKLEIAEAEEEGVRFRFLANPTEIHAENGRVCGMTVQLMELGAPDQSGRRAPVPVAGRTEYLALDSVIMAIGQKLDATDFGALTLTKRGTIEAGESDFTTNLPGVFAVGDATNKGASIAIEAIGEAGRCAKAVDAFLRGEAFRPRTPYLSRRDESRLDFSEREKLPRTNAAVLPAEERTKSFAAISPGLTEAEAKKEAARCLECGCREYYKCRLLNVAQRYDIDPGRLAGQLPQKSGPDENAFLTRDPAKCILCGLCVRACREVTGLNVLGLVGRGFGTQVSTAFALPLDQTNCTACGLCASLCPTGALTEKTLLSKQVPLDERSTVEVVNVDGKDCVVQLTFYEGRLLRVVPQNDAARSVDRRRLIEAVSAARC